MPPLLNLCHKILNRQTRIKRQINMQTRGHLMGISIVICTKQESLNTQEARMK